jgi:hypothetical protein
MAGEDDRAQSRQDKLGNQAQSKISLKNKTLKP